MWTAEKNNMSPKKIFCFCTCTEINKQKWFQATLVTMRVAILLFFCNAHFFFNFFFVYVTRMVILISWDLKIKSARITRFFFVSKIEQEYRGVRLRGQSQKIVFLEDPGRSDAVFFNNVRISVQHLTPKWFFCTTIFISFESLGM